MSKNDCLLNIYTHNLMLSIFNKIFQTHKQIYSRKEQTKDTQKQQILPNNVSKFN